MFGYHFNVELLSHFAKVSFIYPSQKLSWIKDLILQDNCSIPPEYDICPSITSNQPKPREPSETAGTEEPADQLSDTKVEDQSPDSPCCSLNIPIGFPGSPQQQAPEAMESLEEETDVDSEGSEIPGSCSQTPNRDVATDQRNKKSTLL